MRRERHACKDCEHIVVRAYFPYECRGYVVSRWHPVCGWQEKRTVCKDRNPRGRCRRFKAKEAPID